jgi:hypothetical protein
MTESNSTILLYLTLTACKITSPDFLHSIYVVYNTHVNPDKTVFTFCTVYVGYNMHVFISADDMGLGKTLSMISLVLKAKEESENKDHVEDVADSEEDEEGDSSWCSKNKKCKFHCPFK